MQTVACMAASSPATPPLIGLILLDHDGWMGGTIYVRNLVYALDALPADERPVVRLIGTERARPDLVNDLLSFDFVEGPQLRTPLAALAGRAARRLRRVATGAGGPIAYDGVDIVFPALHTDHPNGTRHLYWIPDFQHEHMPELFSAEELATRRAKDAAIAKIGGHLILSSRMALDDFRRLYPDARTVPHVWSFCTTMSAHEQGGRDPIAAYGAPRKYVYIPNQFWAHKNHETAFRALGLQDPIPYYKSERG